MIKRNSQASMHRHFYLYLLSLILSLSGALREPSATITNRIAISFTQLRVAVGPMILMG